MNWLALASLALAALMNSVGTALLRYVSVYKAKPDHSTSTYWGLFVLAFLLFGGSFPPYTYGLGKIQLSLAQPVFALGTYIFVALIAVFFFSEAYSPLKVAGLCAIFAGVVMMAKG
jgi:multidrug transporter EmrE-like cation transporter